jgi:hypothetical protein
MATVKLIPLAEAQQTRRPRTPGVRRQRMNEFDGYVRVLLDNPTEAAVFEGIEEAPQKFVLSLRGALKRAGVAATVRKLRNRDEVRAWLGSSNGTHAHAAERELVGV